MKALRNTVLLCMMISLLCVESARSDHDHDHKDSKAKLKRKHNNGHKVYEDPSEVSVFYSIPNNSMIRNMSARPWFAPGQSLKLPFIGDPCACSDYQCGCCAGIRISQINFDRQVCANMSFDSYLLGLVLDVSVNNHSVLHNVYSGRNPPPICIPVPLGPIPGVTFCIILFDISIIDFKYLHVCMDWELRLISFPILVLHFDCVNIGIDGLTFVKPEDSQDPSTTQQSSDPQINGDVYDEVTETSPATENTNVRPLEEIFRKFEELKNQFRI